ncbi:uncharacterized protein LOC125371384 [Ricinus communis]|uniref:uncharacterized protein LOC125371384 n=1 Tax=Ricinus communis TaxID=3988 RepID=UPI00201AD076|nr:uncharacterized protein LOC125371384 [Ricinus communis]
MEGKSGSINVKEKGECCYFSETEVEEEEEDEDPIGISLHKLNLGPKKKLLVLSLGVLCQKIRAFKKDRPKNCSPDATYGSILVYKRPHCEDFIKFCFERFVVGIWSSALELNQEECTDSGFKSLENINKPLFLKELRKLWESSSSSLGQYSSSNTLLIDDKPYKALLNSVIQPFHLRTIFMRLFYAFYSSSSSNSEEEGGGILLERPFFRPRKKLLVISLGGLLCARVCRRDTSNIPQSRPPDAAYGSILENKSKPIFLRELNKLWAENNNSNLLLLTQRYSSSDILLIDDKPYKALLNPFLVHFSNFNFVFSCSLTLGNDLYDTGLRENCHFLCIITGLRREGGLWIYLDGLAKADDVHTYVKNHPFGQPAITAMRPDWDYYSKIVHRQSKE